MRKLKLISALLVFSLMFVLCGCSSKEKDAVNQYFSDIKSQDITFRQMMNEAVNKEMDKINVKDVSRSNIDEFNDKMSQKYADNFKDIAYKINKSSVDGKSATVNVTVIGTNFSDVYKNQFIQAVRYIEQQKSLGSNLSEDDITKYIDNLLDNCIGDVSKSERTGDIHLSKESGKWKVTFDESLFNLITGIDFNTFENISASN